MTTPYSAAASMQGYLYQCKWALLAAIKKLRLEGMVTVNLEWLDDIDFPEIASPAELLQVKYHQSRLATITNASPDLWGTLRVWIDNQLAGRVPSDAELFLITTAHAPVDSIAFCLGPDEGVRGVEAAVGLLDEVARTSQSQENATAYVLWADLDQSARFDLVSRITVLDGQGGFEGLDHELEAELRIASPGRAALVARRMEEWWYARCVQHLLSPGSSIIGEEIYAQIAEVADSLRDDRLPIDDVFDVPDVDFYTDRDFIRQLHLAEITGEAIVLAVKDYFRAFTQRSRWEREDLLSVGELGRYEDRLKEEWEIRFRHMTDEVGEGAAELVMIEAAKRLYRWVEADARFPIRTRCSDAFLTRGSYQMLSDQRGVGWHAEFEARLAGLLEPQQAEA